MNETQWPTILKAKRVVGKTLTFKDVSIDDAEFILSLRTDEKKSRFLSTVSADLLAQQAWLEWYKNTTDQAYFLIEYKNERIGTVRLYDAQDGSFCWGSWILKVGSPSQAALESALIVYSYAIDHLGFKAAHFDVRKGNGRVSAFHERFGARCISETDLDLFYQLDLPAIQAARTKYFKYLPSTTTITS